MPLLHRYTFPFSITRLSRARNETTYQIISSFGLSKLTSNNFSLKLRRHINSSCTNLRLKDCSVITNQYVPSASFSNLISARSNIHIKSLQQVRVSNVTTRKMSYQNEQRGSLFNEDFRLYLKDSSGAVVSPMHDIPLR